MRRLAVPAESQRGGISIIVALMMVVILSFAAIAVDVAMLHSERAQLQNGSDAVALMVAQKCAKNEAINCSSTAPLAAALANGNAVDGKSNLKSISVNKDGHTVTVAANALETGSTPGAVSTFFARALGIASAEVSATSSARWGTPSKGTKILPLAIAECKLDLNPGSQAAAQQTVNFGTGCGRVPGGFGWIKGSSECAVTVGVGRESDSTTWFESDPGASAPSACTADDLSELKDKTVLLPLYDKAAGTGDNAGYFIKGFAAFHVTAYRFADDGWPDNNATANKSIRGYFVKFVSLSQAFELGNAPDYGSSVVRLTLGAP